MLQISGIGNYISTRHPTVNIIMKSEVFQCLTEAELVSEVILEKQVVVALPFVSHPYAMNAYIKSIDIEAITGHFSTGTEALFVSSFGPL